MALRPSGIALPALFASHARHQQYPLFALTVTASAELDNLGLLSDTVVTMRIFFANRQMPESKFRCGGSARELWLQATAGKHPVKPGG